GRWGEIDQGPRPAGGPLGSLGMAGVGAGTRSDGGMGEREVVRRGPSSDPRTLVAEWWRDPLCDHSAAVRLICQRRAEGRGHPSATTLNDREKPPNRPI